MVYLGAGSVPDVFDYSDPEVTVTATPAKPAAQFHFTSFNITVEQHDRLTAISRETGIPMAVLVRMAIKEYLDSHHPTEKGPL